MTDLSKSITSDPLMTAKVLKMANSSYFGVAQKIDSIGHALMILGLHNIKNIMYREGMRGLFYAGHGHKGVALAALWRHSNLVCICAQHFHDLFEGLNRGTLFTLGIVHDIGKLMLMEKFHSLGQAAGPGSEYPMDMLIGEEDQIFGINHAVIGGCILEQWNFSELMTRVASMHHTPSFVEADQANLSPEALNYVLALFLSDQVARLFTDWNEGIARIYTLRGSYHGLIDKKKLIHKIIDTNFLNQMRAAEMLAVAEHSPGDFTNALPV
jgi:HD-like signal output (HDOD) protein